MPITLHPDLQQHALQDIKEKTSQLAKLKKGENRNTKGFSAMRSIGKYVIHGVISEREFTDLFRQAYQHNGLLQKIGETEFLSTGMPPIISSSFHLVI